MAPTLSLTSSLIGQQYTSWAISDQWLEEILHIWSKSRHQQWPSPCVIKCRMGGITLTSHIKTNKSIPSSSVLQHFNFLMLFFFVSTKFPSARVWVWGYEVMFNKGDGSPTRCQKALKDFSFLFHYHPRRRFTFSLIASSCLIWRKVCSCKAEWLLVVSNSVCGKIQL